MAYVNFNRGLTRAQIEALTNAVNGKIYFATDGGIYVGKADGTAEEKADINYRTESKTGQEFVYRKSPATIKAKSLTLDRIYGKTLAWNQLINISAFSPSSAAETTLTVVGNKVRINGTATQTYDYVSSAAIDTFVAGHKYLLSHRGSADIKVAVSANGRYPRFVPNADTILTVNTVGLKSLFIEVTNGITYNNAEVTINITDLTILYGSEIDGMTNAEILAKFESEFPGYHDFGNKLISNDAESLETTGFNKWDEEKEKGNITSGGADDPDGNAFRSKNFIQVLPSADYSITRGGCDGSFYFMEYDANKNFIARTSKGSSATTFSTGGNTRFIKICFYKAGSNWGTTFPDFRICINLSDPAKNGTYEPYRKTTLQLGLNNFKVKDGNGNITTITGGLKGDGTWADILYSNNHLTNKAKRVNLGTLSWSYYEATTSYPYGFFTANVSGRRVGALNVLCSKYATRPTFVEDKLIFGNASGSSIYVVDSAYSDAATFKAAMDGVYLDYELATPIEYELVEPLVYSMAAGTTEARISPNSDGLSAPFCCDMTYWIGKDYIDEISTLNEKINIVDDVKYEKPSSGIPKTDLASEVQTSLGKADSAVQSSDLAVVKGSGNNSVKGTNNKLTSNSYGSVALGFVMGNSGGITASGDGAFASGMCYEGGENITASGSGAFAFGFADNHSSIEATQLGAVAVGSSIDGSNITASGKGASANGYSVSGGSVSASGDGALANGYSNYGNISARNKGSIALGCADGDTEIRVTGIGALAHGYAGNGCDIFAIGKGSHAEGCGTNASGDYSHAEGYAVSAENNYEHSQGKYNVSNKQTTGTDSQKAAGSTLFSVGCGTAYIATANAMEIMQNGDLYIKETGGYNGTNPSSATNLQDQLKVLTEHITELTKRIIRIEENENNKDDLSANSIDSRQGYTYNGDLLVIIGSGAPTTIPAFIGQFYIDTTNTKLYFAVGNSAASNWIQA